MVKISGISSVPMSDVPTKFGPDRTTSASGRNSNFRFYLISSVQVSSLRTPWSVEALAWLLACQYKLSGLLGQHWGMLGVD